jgi:hypothetical protein
MDPRIFRRRWVLGVIGMVALGAACGGLTVTKVPMDPAKAEKLTGIRYYLPWPYLVVTKEFPVDAATCFVTGALAANGRDVLLDDATERFLNQGGAMPNPLNAPHLSLHGSSLDLGGVRAGDDSGAKKGGTDAGENTSEGGVAQGGADSSEVLVTGGSGTQPIKLSDALSVVYLLNETEQYAIEANSTLFGTQSVSIQLTNGWMAEGFNVKVDNSETTKFFEGIVNAVLPALEKVIGLQSAEVNLGPTDAPKQVTVRVHTIGYAVPGVYPLLHSQELAAQIKAEPAPSQTTNAPCDPALQRPSSKRIGAFVLNTRSDRVLELVPSPSADNTTSAASPNLPRIAATDCATVAAAKLVAWANSRNIKLGGPTQPHVQGLGFHNGNVTLAIDFWGAIDFWAAPANKQLLLARLAHPPLAVLQTPQCQYTNVKVCEAHTSGCNAPAATP